ncbi:peptidoglycan-binding protein [Streptosporangium carneum]|uniref:Peptidoglycan-binding protein n=1 Tax=Streptosporangium carneum TaxID=47481 RepID=A0A9W6HX42_9ACTN|nr:peptidoglycan-binding protein [Streptosporangium carneum]GLK06979.1 peptidoglycan-binding protein [Streptosporangium carneum]
MLDSDVETSDARRSPPPPGGTPRPRPRRRRWASLGVALALVIGASGGTYYALRGGESSTPQASAALPTVPVVRVDMISVRNVDGTLEHAGSYTVLGGGGRITWLPEAGDVIRRGERVYGVDGHGVPLFYGTTPFWRDLRQGMTGRDVRQLERNLKALGYGRDHGMTVDREFTWATARAVMDWQDDLNVPRTGEVRMDAVTVQPGPIRVTALNAVLGAQAGGTVLTASGTERVITVKLPVNDQRLARKGSEVRVTLPGGKTATGRVTSIGRVASAGATNAQSQTGEGTRNATVAVHVTLDGVKSAGGLDGAPATVGFSGVKHRGVLAVPINALLASGEGEYAVKVVEADGTSRDVPVRLGVFDGDNVEVSGDLAPGMRVEVPRS